MAAEKNNPTTDPTDEQDPEELDDDVEENDEDDDEPGAEAEWTPPTKAEWDAAQARLTAEQAKLKRAREQARKLREGGRGGAPDSEATASAQADVEKWQRRAVVSAARSELVARGADTDMVDLVLGKLKVSEIEFGDDDTPDLEEWLDEMQDRYPKAFKQPDPAPAVAAGRPRPGKVEPGGKAPVRPRMTLGQQIIANSSQGIRPRRRP